jgi:hypothetical protein
MEITREKYLEALDIVEQYHNYLQGQSKKLRFKQFEDMQIGDKVVFRKSMSKYILIDKEYEVICKSPNTENWRDWFGVISDNGKQKRFYRYAQGYNYVIIPN